MPQTVILPLGFGNLQRGADPRNEGIAVYLENKYRRLPSRRRSARALQNRDPGSPLALEGIAAGSQKRVVMRELGGGKVIGKLCRNTKVPVHGPWRSDRCCGVMF